VVLEYPNNILLAIFIEGPLEMLLDKLFRDYFLYTSLIILDGPHVLVIFNAA
jgi:hypothetical protein